MSSLRGMLLSLHAELDGGKRPPEFLIRNKVSGDFMVAMHSPTNIATFNASSCMYWAHCFLSLITRPIIILKTLVVAQ